MTFEHEKKPKLFSISKNLKSNNFWHDKYQFLKKPDKSFAGEVDKEIISLVRKINKFHHYYTTSSCSGRIILMKETGKKQESVFLFVSHSKASFKQLKKALNHTIKYEGIIYLKIEPCIMHVACKDIEHANKLVNLARQAGWKKSGIISTKKDKIMAELVSTEILAAPIINKGEFIIPEDYLKILASECNKKLAQTREKIRKLEKAVKP